LGLQWEVPTKRPSRFAILLEVIKLEGEVVEVVGHVGEAAKVVEVVEAVAPALVRLQMQLFVLSLLLFPLRLPCFQNRTRDSNRHDAVSRHLASTLQMAKWWLVKSVMKILHVILSYLGCSTYSPVGHGTYARPSPSTRGGSQMGQARESLTQTSRFLSKRSALRRCCGRRETPPQG